MPTQPTIPFPAGPTVSQATRFWLVSAEASASGGLEIAEEAHGACTATLVREGLIERRWRRSEPGGPLDVPVYLVTEAGRAERARLLAEHDAAQTIPADVQATLAEIRAMLSSARAMRRNHRKGLYQGRNNGGDYSWVESRAEDKGRTLDWGHDGTRRALGEIWAEHRMAERVAVARHQGQQRPELARRLTMQRRTVRTALVAA